MLFSLLVSTFAQGAVEAAPPRPVVVELFTSQSCSSCPAAEAVLRDLAEKDNVIALEWHVDYWDQLRHGNAGKWKDPFSNAEFTARQRDYNVVLRGTGGVYTPQAIINGQTETVGSRRSELNQIVSERKTQTVTPVIAMVKADSVVFHLGPQIADASLLAVTFKKSEVTEVGGGENKGKTLKEANIVVSAERVVDQGGWLKIQAPSKGYGCALLAQNPKTMAIVGAAYCPSDNTTDVAQLQPSSRHAR